MADERTTGASIRSDWRRGLVISIDDKDSVVHTICPYLRDLKECEMCPEWKDSPRTGGMCKRGCYALAEEVMNICQTGHPHRREGSNG